MIPAGLILLSLVPAAAGTVRLAELARGAAITAANARFFAMPLPVVLHILSIIPFSMLGALQFAPAFRRRNRRWHRAAGLVLVECGLVAALTGLWMALAYPWPAGDGVVVYAERLVFGTAMLLSIILAVDAIRRRDFAAHGAWMTRAYAIGMGAGTQVLTHMPYFLLVGQPTLVRRLRMGVFAALDQRIATRYQLRPMDLAESAGYLCHHLALAGRTDPLFADDAVARLHRASLGLPRALNNLARDALIAAAADGKALVDDTCAKKAVAEAVSE